MNELRIIIRYLVKAVVGFAVGASLYFLSLGVFWMTYPYKVANIQVPIQILNEHKQIAPGETIRMFIILDKYQDIKPSVDTFVICDDQSTFALDGKGKARPVGHFEYIVTDYTLSLGAKAGATCSFHFKNTYQVNPLKTITKNWYSEDFKVEENEK